MAYLFSELDQELMLLGYTKAKTVHSGGDMPANDFLEKDVLWRGR